MDDSRLLEARTSHAELSCLIKYMRLSASKYFLEVGTLNLGTGQRLAEELPDRLIITIDFSNYAYRNINAPKNLMRWLGYSRVYAGLLEQFDLGMKFGVIFLDGGHSYEEVTADKQAWEQHLSEDGVFAIHDTRIVQPYVEALDGNRWTGYREGPALLVKEMQDQGWSLIEEADSISVMERA